MTQTDFTKDERFRAAQTQPRILRLILLSMIAVSGVLMTLIVASEPRVVAQFQSTAQHVSARFGLPDGAAPDAQNAPDGASEPAAMTAANPATLQPSTGQMPRNRVPVRRAGVSISD